MAVIDLTRFGGWHWAEIELDQSAGDADRPPRIVPAVINGPIGISIGGMFGFEAWCLQHLPTGYRIFAFQTHGTSLEECMDVGEALGAAPDADCVEPGTLRRLFGDVLFDRDLIAKPADADWLPETATRRNSSLQPAKDA